MKICLLTHTLPRFEGDTAAPFIGELADALARLGNEVVVLAPFNAKIDNGLKRNFRLVTYKYIIPESWHILGYSETLRNDQSMRFRSYLISPFLYVFGFLALWKLVKKEKIDIISAHWIIPNGFIAALVSKVTTIPYTVTIPGSDVYLGSKNFLFKWLIGYASKYAAAVISDSRYYLDELNKLGFYPPDPQVIGYGVNTHKFKLAAAIPERPIILAVGRLVAKKGFRFLVAAMPEIVKKIPDVKLTIIGDGNERKFLENEAQSLGVAENIDFKGMVPYPNLIACYQKAGVFVMPSIRDRTGNIDASPVALMIAIATGCPFIATRFALSRDSVPKDIGYIVKDKNSEEIAQTVTAVLKQKYGSEKRKRIREYALKNFSVDVSAKKYLTIFQQVVRP